MRSTYRVHIVVATAGLTALVSASGAYAVPSFARQTGMACSVCHSAGFYPELNAFGRYFKMHGYLLSTHADEPYEPYPPLAAAQMWSYTYTNQSQPGLTKEPTLTYATNGNNNFSYPQQANFFLAGRFYGPVGGFVMGTYDAVDNAWAFDNTDIRVTGTRAVGDHSVTFGLTFNNGPSVQDAWNTLPAWSQYIGSEIAAAPAAAISMSDLSTQVSGVHAVRLGQVRLLQLPHPRQPHDHDHTFRSILAPRALQDQGQSLGLARLRRAV
jgi:hypothetical protein